MVKPVTIARATRNVDWLPYRNDLVLLGSVFGILGAALGARGVIMHRGAREEAQSFLGFNPFLVKAAIFQRWDNIVSFLWILVGFLAGFIGTLQAARDPEGSDRWLLSDPVGLVGMLAQWVIILFALSVWALKKLAMKEAAPAIVGLQRHLVDSALGVLERDGVHEMYLVPGATPPSPEDRERHLKDARRRLHQVATLLDLPRQPGETEVQHAQRLKAYSSRYPATPDDAA